MPGLVSLNAEPGAVAAFPGCTMETSHDWFGWPVVPDVCGSAASVTLASAHVETAANMAVRFVFILKYRMDPDSGPHHLEK